VWREHWHTFSVTGIVFPILESQNKFIRFHALQSIMIFGAVTVADVLFRFMPVVGWILRQLSSMTRMCMKRGESLNLSARDGSIPHKDTPAHVR